MTLLPPAKNVCGQEIYGVQLRDRQGHMHAHIHTSAQHPGADTEDGTVAPLNIPGLEEGVY